MSVWRANTRKQSIAAQLGAVAIAALTLFVSATSVADTHSGSGVDELSTAASTAVQQPGASGIAVLSAHATFDKYETRLDEAGQRVLDDLLEELKAFTRILSIRVIGHADARGQAADNLVLSFERAETMEKLLRERFQDVHITSTGAGETQPIADNATEEGRALNRRVELQVIALARNE